MGMYERIVNPVKNYLDPEQSNPGTFRKFASNLVQNARELSGTTSEDISRNLQNRQASQNLLFRTLDPKRYYIPPSQIPEMQQQAKEFDINIGGLSPVMGTVRGIIRPEERAKNLAKFMEGSKATHPVYHGGEKEIISFSESPQRGIGFGSTYFSDKRSVADSYAKTGQPPESELARNFREGHVTSAYLSLKNPINEGTSFREFFNDDGEKALNHIDGLVDENELDDLRDLYRKNEDKFWDEIETTDLSNLNVNSELFTPLIESSPLLRSLGNYSGTEYLNKTLKNSIYDGIIHSDFENGGNTFIPFKPTQIKSATENRGTFDPSDRNILNALIYNKMNEYENGLNNDSNKLQ